MTVCNYCKGRGYPADNSRDFCSHCKGRGFMTDKEILFELQRRIAQLELKADNHLKVNEELNLVYDHNKRMRKRIERLEETVARLQPNSSQQELSWRERTRERIEALEQERVGDGKVIGNLRLQILDLQEKSKRVAKNEKFRQYTPWVGSTPRCPKCDKYMDLKTNNSTGNKFWGCTTWPTCWGTRDHPDTTKDRGRSLNEHLPYDSEHGHHPKNQVWNCYRTINNQWKCERVESVRNVFGHPVNEIWKCTRIR